MFALWITAALLAAPALAAPRQKGSPYFHTCRHRARAWDDCVAAAAQELRPLFVDGIPELGVRPIDPLCTDEVHFSEASGKFRINLRMANVTMEGFRDYVVTGVRSDLQELTLDISMRVPSLTFRARYHMDGRFLFLALSGDGTCQYNLTDVENLFHVKGHLVRRVSDDALHFRVASLRWTMRPARGSFRFSAPEGEPSLYSQATSRLLNQQAEESWTSFQDAVQRGFAEIFREHINRLMMHIPYRHLFPAGVLPLHLLEIPMDDNEADEYPPLQWTRPPTTSTTSSTSTSTTTTPAPTTMDDNAADEHPPLQWTRPPTTSTTSSTSTSTTTTPAPTTMDDNAADEHPPLQWTKPPPPTSPTSTTTSTTPAPTTTDAPLPTTAPAPLTTTTANSAITLQGHDAADVPEDGDGGEVPRVADGVAEQSLKEAEDAPQGSGTKGEDDADEGLAPDTSTTRPLEADDARDAPIAFFDTAFILLASSTPPPASTAPLEDVVFIDKMPEKRTEYVVVEAAEPPPSSTARALDEAEEDATEADSNNIPTDEEDGQLARSRDLRGAETPAVEALAAPQEANNATDEGSLSLAVLGQAVEDVAKGILAEAAEVLLEAWRGEATTLPDEATTVAA